MFLVNFMSDPVIVIAVAYLLGQRSPRNDPIFALAAIELNGIDRWDWEYVYSSQCTVFLLKFGQQEQGSCKWVAEINGMALNEHLNRSLPLCCHATSFHFIPSNLTNPKSSAREYRDRHGSYL